MDEVEVETQTQLDRAKIAQTRKTCDGKEGIDRAKNETEAARPIRVRTEPSGESEYAAEEMEEVVGGWKGKIEHFVAEGAGHANHDQDEAAEDGIDLCECAFHCWRNTEALWSLRWGVIQRQERQSGSAVLDVRLDGRERRGGTGQRPILSAVGE